MKTLSFFLCLILGVGLACASQKTGFIQDKPTRLYLESDTQTMDSYSDTYSDTVEVGSDADDDDGGGEYQVWSHYNHVWKDANVGHGSRRNKSLWDSWDWQGNHSIYSETNSAVMTWTTNGSGTETDTYIDGLTSTYAIGLPDICNEHCSVKDPVDTSSFLYYEDDAMTEKLHQTYTRTAQTKWRLLTGGRTGRTSLWQISGGATEILDKRAQPCFSGANNRGIPATQVIVLGKALPPEGYAWRLLPDGASLDATPYVAGKDFYAFSVGAQKYLSYFEAFDRQPNPGFSLWPNNITINPFDVDYGHVFWRLTTDAPEEAQHLYLRDLEFYLGKQCGFFSDGIHTCGHVGNIDYDEANGTPNIYRKFRIGFPQLRSALLYTQNLDKNPPEYCFSSFNCAIATMATGRNAGVNLPWDQTPQNWGVTLVLKMYPGPLWSDDVFDPH